MKRRQLLTRLALGTATTYTITACQPQPTPQPTPSQPLIRWRMATSWPKSLDILFGSAETLCRRVEQMTEGRFSIIPYPANEILPPLKILDGVVGATVECGHSAINYDDRNPSLGLVSGLPFGMNTHQQNAWLYSGGGLEEMQKMYRDLGVNAFPAGNTGLQMGGWFTRKINTVNDLKGLRMRIPWLAGKILERLGVQAQVLPAEEIFPALEQGKLDAAEWIGPYDDEKLGLNRVAPYYYYPGWWEPSTIVIALVNRTEWDKLPKEYQEIFRAAALEAYFLTSTRYDAVNGEALDRIILSGTELVPYNLEILQAAYNAAVSLYDEYAANHQEFARVYQEWQRFRSQISQWHRVNELTYANFTGSLFNIE